MPQSLRLLSGGLEQHACRTSANIVNRYLVHDQRYRSGLIVPRVHGADHGGRRPVCARGPGRLPRSAARRRQASEGGQSRPVNIPEAAKLAFCMSEEVVRLILDGKLVRKWRLRGERGYMAVLVDVTEVRALVRGPDHGGLTGMEIKDKLSTTAKVARLS
jgi:hypothetical protein